jgi:hypothetical protein
MARKVANVDIITDTFEIWLLQTNQLLHSLSTEIITANSTVANTGNTDLPRTAQLYGTFGANTIVVTDFMRGGNVVGGHANLVITTNTIVSNTNSTTLLFQVANNTLSSNVTVNSFKTGIFTGNSIAMSVGANVIANSSALLVGNSTQNAVITGTTIVLGNSSVNTQIVSNSTVSVIDHDGYIRVAGNADFANTIIVVGNGTFSNLVTFNGNLVFSNTTAIISNGSAGANGNLLASNGSATYWFTQPAPPAPSGSNTNVTFNDSGNFGGSNGFTFDKTTNNVTIANTLSVGGSLTVAGVTSTANINVSNNVVSNPQFKSYKEFVSANTSTTGATTIDLSVSNVFRHVLTGNTTYTFSNPPSSGVLYSFTLVAQQDASGSRVIVWPATAKWPGALQPPQTTTANGIDIWNFVTYDGGSTYLGTLAGKDVR